MVSLQREICKLFLRPTYWKWQKEYKLKSELMYIVTYLQKSWTISFNVVII